MRKGNHVFNDFDGALESALYQTASFDMRDNINAMNSRGTAPARAAEAMFAVRSRYVHSYELLKRIKEHERVIRMHAIQDDQRVLASDPNSMAFGAAKLKFVSVVVSWINGVGSADAPLGAWREMINVGVDKCAWDNYVKEAPSGSAIKRNKECSNLKEFLLGEFTRLAALWLLNLKTDEQLANPTRRGVMTSTAAYDKELRQVR